MLPQSKELKARHWIHFQLVETWTGAGGTNDNGSLWLGHLWVYLEIDGPQRPCLKTYVFDSLAETYQVMEERIYLLKHL